MFNKTNRLWNQFHIFPSKTDIWKKLNFVVVMKLRKMFAMLVLSAWDRQILPNSLWIRAFNASTLTRWMHTISKIGSQVFSVDVVWNRTKSSNNDQQRSYDFIWLQSEMPLDTNNIFCSLYTESCPSRRCCFVVLRAESCFSRTSAVKSTFCTQTDTEKANF